MSTTPPQVPLPTDPLQTCSRCGQPIPADAPAGVCPACALAAAELSQLTPPASKLGDPPAHESLVSAFPQLEIFERIGQGGMGWVYKARQLKLDRLVALKLLPGKLAAEPSFRERFEREGRILASLQHPGIVAAHDFGEATAADGTAYFYLLLEYVDGVNLRQAMRLGRFTAAQALEVVPQICAALQKAHSCGVLHRDIKPENILLDRNGQVKITDFGLAKLAPINQPADDAAESRLVTRLTQTGTGLGTPLYMAPEQILNPATVDHRADIYSLGVVFYELLTGELPLGRFSLPSEKASVDTRIDDIVLRTLAREREQRQQSAAEVKSQIETVTSTPAITAEPIAASPSAWTSFFLTRPQRERDWLLRSAWLLAILASLVFLWPNQSWDPIHSNWVNGSVRLTTLGAGLPWLTQTETFAPGRSNNEMQWEPRAASFVAGWLAAPLWCLTAVMLMAERSLWLKAGQGGFFWKKSNTGDRLLPARVLLGYLSSALVMGLASGLGSAMLFAALGSSGGPLILVCRALGQAFVVTLILIVREYAVLNPTEPKPSDSRRWRLAVAIGGIVLCAMIGGLTFLVQRPDDRTGDPTSTIVRPSAAPLPVPIAVDRPAISHALGMPMDDVFGASSATPFSAAEAKAEAANMIASNRLELRFNVAGGTLFLDRTPLELEPGFSELIVFDEPTSGFELRRERQAAGHDSLRIGKDEPYDAVAITWMYDTQVFARGYYKSPGLLSLKGSLPGLENISRNERNAIGQLALDMLPRAQRGATGFATSPATEADWRKLSNGPHVRLKYVPPWDVRPQDLLIPLDLAELAALSRNGNTFQRHSSLESSAHRDLIERVQRAASAANTEQ